MTIKQYIQKQGQFTFQDLPFNDVDGLILSLLSYIDFEGIVSKDRSKQITLSKASDLFFKKYTSKEIKKFVPTFIRKLVLLFQMMATTERYKDILFYNYVKEIEQDTQFGALCMLLNDGTLFISFEGTDDSISGWKEDFQMSYQFPVLAQQKAGDYLRKNVSIFGPRVRIGGHSKGGNLAMASYLLSDFLIRAKVLCIYNNDGPGFRKKEYDSRVYKKMEKKLTMIVPEESLVGMLFRHSMNYEVVKSNSHSFFQHDGTSWLVEDTSFQKGKLSKKSKKLEKRIFQWINSYSDEEREKIFRIHIAKRRKQDVESINVSDLVTKPKGFSGADIEGVVKD
ncbi:MAG: DUF2974 domain-containing protein, partial [Bacilli bacterium]|nr:DUF2974 domain-containing protein [Bacilli bacterium]